jgi:hypothetical protein
MPSSLKRGGTEFKKAIPAKKQMPNEKAKKTEDKKLSSPL